MFYGMLWSEDIQGSIQSLLSILSLYINIDKGCNFFAKEFEHTQQNSCESSSCLPLCNQIRIKRKLDSL